MENRRDPREPRDFDCPICPFHPISFLPFYISAASVDPLPQLCLSTPRRKVSEPNVRPIQTAKRLPTQTESTSIPCEWRANDFPDVHVLFMKLSFLSKASWIWLICLLWTWFHGQRGEEFMRLGHSALELQKKTPKLRTSAPNSFIAVPVEHYQTRRLHSNASLLWQKGSLCRGTNENEKPHSRWKRGWYLPWLGEVGICCQNTKTHTRTHKHSAAVQCFSEKMQLEHTNHSQDPDCPKVESVQLFTLLWSLYGYRPLIPASIRIQIGRPLKSICGQKGKKRKSPWS